MKAMEATENWNDLREQIKRRWSKLSDREIESLKDNLDEVTNLLQTSYGYAIDQAEKEYDEFKSSLTKVWNEAKENRTFGIVAALSLLSLIVTTGMLTSAIFRKRA